MSMYLSLIALPESEIRKASTDAGYAQELFDSREVFRCLDLDKLWDALAFLLCDYRRKSDGPYMAPPDGLGRCVAGGTVMNGEVDLGYGPPSYLPATEVKELAARLRELDLVALRKRFDPVTMKAAHVYPEVWDEKGILDTELLPMMRRVSSFYSDAAKSGLAVVIALY